MLEEPARRADENVAPGDSGPLELEVLPTNDKASTEVVLFADSSEDLKYLVGELPGGGDHQTSNTVCRAPLSAEQFLQERNQERESLSGARLGGA